MKFETKNAFPSQELLHSYSGRRLQFAIKMGILPPPENLSKLLKEQENKTSRNAHPNKYWKERLPLTWK